MTTLPLDFTPLQTSHLLLFGVAFGLVYGLFALILRYGPQWLRGAKAGGAVYGGVVLIGIISLLGYFVIDDARLRIGLLGAAFLALVVGIIDEQRTLAPWTQFWWQVVIATIAGLWGWSITVISNPWNLSLPGAHDGVIDITWLAVGAVALPALLLTVGWLVFLMNAINWLDGVDGLAGGVGAVALLTLAAVSLLPSIQDAHTLTLAMLGAGSLLGFWLWNFAPARVYLGTSGSWFVGLYIGMIAIVGGGKIVTTLLVLALPVFDVLVVSLARVLVGQRPWEGDTVRHFHHRLLAVHMSPRTVALLGIAISATLGAAAILLQTEEKVLAFVIAGCIMGILLLRLLYAVRRAGKPLAAQPPTGEPGTVHLRKANL